MTAAPVLRFRVPNAWNVANPHDVVWTPDLPDGVAFGVLAPALSLDTLIDGQPVQASATVVVTRTHTAFSDSVPTEALAPAGDDDVQVQGPVDLPIGAAHRVQTFWAAASAVPQVAPGPRASVQYLVPHNGWLVTLTFDTGSFSWAGPLIDVFDDIAIAAEWTG